MGFDKEGYWSPREILGYDAKFMLILSDRGRGKTVALKKLMVTQEGQFMCLFRDSSDMAHAIKSWPGDLVNHHGMKWEQFDFIGSEKDGFQMTVDGSVKGYFRFLSGVNHIKQENFPETLNYVWLDEFIPMVYKKLQGVKSEGDALRTIMKTIDHDSVHPRETRGLKKLRCFLVGNPHDWNNPILSYFHVDAALGYGVHRIGPDIVLENIEPVIEETHTKMTVDDFLGDEVHKATGWKKQVAFLKGTPKGSVPMYSIRVRHRFYAVMKAPNGDIHVEERSQHVELGKGRTFGSLEGMQAGESSLMGGLILKTLKARIMNGGFLYPDINVKFDFQNDINEL